MKTKTLQTLYLPPSTAVIALGKQPEKVFDNGDDVSVIDNCNNLLLIGADEFMAPFCKVGDTLDLGECHLCKGKKELEGMSHGRRRVVDCWECIASGRLKRTVKAVKLKTAIQLVELDILKPGWMNDFGRYVPMEEYVVLVELQ